MAPAAWLTMVLADVRIQERPVRVAIGSLANAAAGRVGPPALAGTIATIKLCINYATLRRGCAVTYVAALSRLDVKDRARVRG